MERIQNPPGDDIGSSWRGYRMLLEMEHTQDAGIFRGDTRSYWRKGNTDTRGGSEIYKNGEMRILEGVK